MRSAVGATFCSIVQHRAVLVKYEILLSFLQYLIYNKSTVEDNCLASCGTLSLDSLVLNIPGSLDWPPVGDSCSLELNRWEVLS